MLAVLPPHRSPDRVSQSVWASLDHAGEQALIGRCRAGDRSAQDEFYGRYKRLVAANLYRVIGRHGELEDLVQDAFVIAFRGLAGFRGDAKLSTWLYRICVNVALAHLRKQRRKPTGLQVENLEVTASNQQLLGSPESPMRAVERRQAAERVYRALDTLAPKKRLVLYLHEIEGRDLTEIAYLVDSNAVTVRTRLFYARREFYAALTNLDAATAGSAAPADGASTAAGTVVTPKGAR